MTTTRPATTSALLHPRPLQALRRWVDALLPSIRRARRTSRRSTHRSASAPPLTLWQIDRDELSSALEHSHW